MLTDDKVGFLEAFWSAFKTLVPDAFEGPEQRRQDREEFGRRYSSNIGKKSGERKKEKNEKDERRCLLLTALGIYAVHRLARDLLHVAIKERIDFRQAGFLKEKLSPIKSFDWKTKTSPLSALGGMKGVGKAYDLLSEVLGQEKYSPNVEKSLEAYAEARAIERAI